MNIAYFTTFLICSFNALFHFILGARGIGKTWAFKIRAVRRAIKKRRATYWVRRFRPEVKKTTEKFFRPKLLKHLGMSFYNKETNPNGSLKQDGSKFYVKRKNGEWFLFLEVVALCDYQNYRSADDDTFDTIVFDEFTTTARRYKMFVGNEVEAFLDFFVSVKRETKMKAFFLGNKETISNPYFDYFGIKPLPLSFQGVRTYRNGSIVIEQRNDVVNADKLYNDKFTDLVQCTAYGDYLLKGTAKTSKAFKSGKRPPQATLYMQVYFNGADFNIRAYNGNFYIASGVDKTHEVWSNTTVALFPRQKALVGKCRPLLWKLYNAIQDGRVSYNEQAVFEQASPFIKWLCAVSP